MKIHPDAVEGQVRVEDSDVTYYDTGTPGDGRTPVVLIHGTGGSATSHFRILYPMLAARHRVLAINFSHLENLTRELRIEDLAAQVIAVLEDRAADTGAHLVGYSLGAAVSATIAADRPELVNTLTLIAGWAKTDQQQALRNSIWHRLFHGDRDALREFTTFEAYGHPFLGSLSETEVAALVAARSFPPGIEEQMKLNRNINILDKIGGICAPTLIVGCTYDHMVPIKHSRLLFGAIPDARLAEVPSGHAAPMERPAQLFQLIDGFVVSPQAVRPGTTLASISV
ncbi:alpha/beta hydrolase [Cryobacterium sp. PH29-G1]|uniref:alpha/beta fold hydrolase n=1 Tax=Cryobacterium sp. PH29-G1 TaxID=3046211 RepID=UPI0024B8FA83|nr:alpha/beta hydrolase [Cryobacterium sp. PH29-G1]MDJ0350764.1 alpha/beta hydrolase [Cryobacterium sp. PH29-G1]